MLESACHLTLRYMQAVWVFGVHFVHIIDSTWLFTVNENNDSWNDSKFTSLQLIYIYTSCVQNVTSSWIFEIATALKSTLLHIQCFFFCPRANTIPKVANTAFSYFWLHFQNKTTSTIVDNNIKQWMCFDIKADFATALTHKTTNYCATQSVTVWNGGDLKWVQNSWTCHHEMQKIQ